jgi:hypothetical protein
VTLLAGPAESGQADGSGGSRRQKFCLHGAPLEIDCGYAPLAPQIEWALGPFTATGGDWPAGTVPTRGTVQPYDLQVITPRLSPNAVRWVDAAASHDGEPLELYQDNERFWLVDPRWGMTEINLLHGQWRSWVLPEPKIDPVRCAELTVVWPLAQLLRGRGLHLVPAASAVRDGWAVLIPGLWGLEPELTAMIQANYRLIGQRWTAIREEEGRLALLSMPGRVERASGPRLADPAQRSDFFNGDAGWIDLTSEHRGSRQAHAFCDAVLWVTPGRRDHAELRDLPLSQALSLLRQSWPIVELHPARRWPLLPAKLARHCPCAQAQLSRDNRELLALLDQLHARSALPVEIGPASDEACDLEIQQAEPEHQARSQAA